MRHVDCLLVGHYSLSVNRQVQLAELAFGKDSLYYHDALEKTFVDFDGQSHTSSQLYNRFYEPEGDLSFDHVTFEHSMNTAVANVGTSLARKGFAIEYVNTFNRGRARLADVLATRDVLAVALTSTFYVSAFPIAQIARFIRRHHDRVKIVVGGPFIKNLVTSHAGDPAELQRILQSLGADIYVVSSEGEQTLAMLLAALRAGDSLARVPNIYYRTDTAFRFTRPQLEENEFRTAMVDWSRFRDDTQQLVNLRTTKSCPFDCAFCGLPVTGGRWKQLPLEELERELDQVTAGGARPGVFFIDETLNFPPKRFKEMLQLFLRKDYGFKWEGELRCNTLDREAVRMMADSGCQLVHLGIESGSQLILDNMSKRAQRAEYDRALDLLHEHGIMTSALVIVGFPGETEETFRETFDFLEHRRPTLFRVHRWFYDHDTPIHQRREELRIRGGGYSWEHSTMDSTRAHELATQLSLTVEHAIHTDDYTMAFYLANKGYSHDKIRVFLKSFDLAVRAKCAAIPDPVAGASHIETMRTALR